MARLWREIRARLKNRRFLQAGGLLMLANVIVTALALVRTPAMTWMLPKDQVGMLGVVASYLPFLQLLSLSGMDTAAYHYASKGQPAAFIINLAYRLRWSLISAVGFLLLAGWWFWRGNAALGWMLVVAGVTYPLVLGLSANSGMLAAQERFTSLFWYRIWESLTDFAGFLPLLLAVVWVSPAFTFYTSNQVATAAQQVIYALWIVAGLRRQNTPPLPPADRRELVRYGRHQTAMNAIGVVQTRSDLLVVGAFLPLNVMADYSIATLIYEQFKRLWVIYGSVRYPPLVRLPQTRRFKRMLIEGALVLGGFSLAALALGLASRWLVALFLPPSYLSSLPYIYWLLGAFVAGVPGFMAEMFFRTEQDEKRQYQMRIAAALVGVAMPLLLVQFWGAVGVVIGRFLASLTMSVFGVILALVWRCTVPGKLAAVSDQGQ